MASGSTIGVSIEYGWIELTRIPNPPTSIANELVINKTAHWLRLGSADAAPNGVLTAEQAMIIDEKSDDGRPGTGSVRTVNFECTDEALDADIDGASAYIIDASVTGCETKFEL